MVKINEMYLKSYIFLIWQFNFTFFQLIATLTDNIRLLLILNELFVYICAIKSLNNICVINWEHCKKEVYLSRTVFCNISPYIAKWLDIAWPQGSIRMVVFDNRSEILYSNMSFIWWFGRFFQIHQSSENLNNLK